MDEGRDDDRRLGRVQGKDASVEQWPPARDKEREGRGRRSLHVRRDEPRRAAGEEQRAKSSRYVMLFDTQVVLSFFSFCCTARVVFFRGTHAVSDDFRLSHVVG